MTSAPDSPARARGKSPAAFRTIAEVATELSIPAHVLRFWESKFPQLQPLKRGGGRRYYRPEDVALLRRIRSLLHADGYTIKGVQRLLREGGRPSVAAACTTPEAPAPLVAATGTAAPPTQPDRTTIVVDRALLEAILSELEALRDTLRGD